MLVYELVLRCISVNLQTLLVYQLIYQLDLRCISGNLEMYVGLSSSLKIYQR